MSKKTVETMTSPRLAPVRPLVLASTSRYRRDLLGRLGLAFTAVASGVDETPRKGETPAGIAVRLAEAKARATAPRHPQSLIIGADQVADFAGHAIGKPRNREHAVEQLKAMRGRTIVFHNGLALLDASSGRCQV